jgi:hypothetical protein
VAKRLFGQAEAAAGWNLPAWLGPAFAVGLVFALVFGGGLSRTAGANHHEGLPVMAALSFGGFFPSNELALTGSPAPLLLNKVDFNLNNNLCAKAIFEWTNAGHSPSSNRSFQSVWTNRDLL